jgi:hypothetical protein
VEARGQKTHTLTTLTSLDKDWRARVRPGLLAHNNSSGHLPAQQRAIIEENWRENEVIGGFTDLEVAVSKPTKQNVNCRLVCTNVILAFTY